MSKSKEVSLFGDKTTLPATAQEDVHLGNENVDGSALAVPQIKLLQALSPELRAVDGAQVGHLFNNVSNELYEALYVINLKLDHTFTVWKDRKKGGGKFGEFNTEAEAVAHIATLDGNAVDYHAQETHKHSLLLLDGEGKVVGPAIVYMKATQLRPSRNWNTEIHQTKAARFAGVWTLSSVMERNARNEEYANYAVSFAGFASEGLYEQAKDVYYAISGAPRPEVQDEAA